MFLASNGSHGVSIGPKIHEEVNKTPSMRDKKKGEKGRPGASWWVVRTSL
jgi:hypothetical protein